MSARHRWHRLTRQRARQWRGRLAGLREPLRAEAGEAELEALLETSAEVPRGLDRTFDDYAAKNEAAWR